MTAVDIIANASYDTYAKWAVATAAANATYKCPQKVTVTLTANVGTAWATAAIKKISTAILTDSDGYMMGLQAGKINNLVFNATGYKWEGGCVKTATSNAICFRTTAVGSAAAITNMSATFQTATEFKITKLVAGAAITAAKWGLTYVPVCNAVSTPVVAACTTTFAVNSILTYGGTWW